MELTALAHILCLTLSSPEFYLNKSRKRVACDSMQLVVEESIKNDIDPTLLAALIYVESSWNKRAVSHANACGLTQVIPKYTGGSITGGRKYTCRKLMNPKTSIIVGAKILRYWIHEYGKGEIKVGLCGYSSGYRCKGKRRLRSGFRYGEKVFKIQKKIQKRIKKIQEM